MSHLHECPKCLYLFVHRKFDYDKGGLRCRKCNVLIIHVKELFAAEDEMYLCVGKGDERAMHPWNPTTRKFGTRLDWEDTPKENRARKREQSK